MKFISFILVLTLLNIFVQVNASTYSINCVIDGTLKVGGYPVPAYVAGSGVTFTPTSNYTFINATSGGISIAYQGIGISTIVQGSDNTHFISPTLNAGTAIGLTNNSNGIFINALTTVASDTTCIGCISLISGLSTNPNYLLKPLEAGPSITLTDSSSKITFGLSLLDVGLGTSIIGSDRASLKTLLGISGIGVSSNNSNVILSNTDGASKITLTSLGAGISLISSFSSNPNYYLNSLGSGSGIGISNVGNVTYFTNTDPASGISLTSVGSGSISLIASSSLNPNLKLVSLDPGSGIGMTSIANVVTVSNTDPGSAVTLTSTGSGFSLVSDGIGAALSTKSVSALSGLSITSNATDVIWANTDGASKITLSSLGSGTSLVSSFSSNPNYYLNSLGANTGIGLSTVGNTTFISNTVAVSSVGSGNSIWASTTITNIQSKSLIGNGIGITNNPNDLTFTSNVGTCTTSTTVDFPSIKGPACSTAQVVTCSGFPTSVHACFVLPIYGTCDGIYQCASTGTSGQVSINFCSPSTSSTGTPNPAAYNPTVMWVL